MVVANYSSPVRTLGSQYLPQANNLNLIRLILASLVIASHSYVIALGMQHGAKNEPLWATHGRCGMGDMAVGGFFSLSGFLLASSWCRGRGLVDFFRRRLLRIYPGFLVCIFFCVLVVGPLTVPDVAQYFKDPRAYGLLRYLYFGRFLNELPNAFSGNPMPGIINSSLWTIKYEIICYCALAVWARFGLLQPIFTLGLK